MTAVADLRRAAGSVPDPEIPVLTLDDLGIVRDVRVAADGAVEADLTPTYTGCPATEVIARDVAAALRAAGAPAVRVRTVLSPAWTTDWMSEAGRRKLREYGIAPPGPAGPAGPRGPVPVALGRRPVADPSPPGALPATEAPACPRCGSADTREVSRFGSTPCQEQHVCRACLEPFDAFTAI